MQPFQQRVVEEEAQLDERLSKLNAFIDDPRSPFGTLPEDEQARLRTQAEVMGEYSAILRDRIAAFDVA